MVADGTEFWSLVDVLFNHWTTLEVRSTPSGLQMLTFWTTFKFWLSICLKLFCLKGWKIIYVYIVLKILKYSHIFIGFYKYIKIQNSGPRYTSKTMSCPKQPSIFDSREYFSSPLSTIINLFCFCLTFQMLLLLFFICKLTLTFKICSLNFMDIWITVWCCVPGLLINNKTEALHYISLSSSLKLHARIVLKRYVSSDHPLSTCHGWRAHDGINTTGNMARWSWLCWRWGLDQRWEEGTVKHKRRTTLIVSCLPLIDTSPFLVYGVSTWLVRKRSNLILPNLMLSLTNPKPEGLSATGLAVWHYSNVPGTVPNQPKELSWLPITSHAAILLILPVHTATHHCI